MIFRTRLLAVAAGVASLDADGTLVYDYPTADVPFLGEFQPLGSDEYGGQGGAPANAITRFRVLLPARIILSTNSKVRYLGAPYSVEGEPEPHNVGGRVDHWECLVTKDPSGA